MYRYLEGNHVSELLFQIPTIYVEIGGSWRGKLEILENAHKCCRFVTDVTGLDPLSLGKLGMGFSALASLVLLDVLGR